MAYTSLSFSPGAALALLPIAVLIVGLSMFALYRYKRGSVEQRREIYLIVLTIFVFGTIMEAIRSAYLPFALGLADSRL
jgi:hypothetical protein